MSMIPVIGKIPTAQNVNFAKSLKRCHQVVDDVIDQKLQELDTGIYRDYQRYRIIARYIGYN